jgi:hypothetical protein
MGNDNENKTVLVAVSRLPSILEIEDEEGYSKKARTRARKGNFEEVIKSQYQNIYRIFKNRFSFFSNGSQGCTLELLADVDNISGDLTKLSGWLEVPPKDENVYDKRSYAEVSLIPLRTQSRLIYHFKGTLEWTAASDRKGRVVPLSVVPVYGVPSGRIIELKPEKIGDSEIFENAKVEYRSLDLRLGDE